MDAFDMLERVRTAGWDLDTDLLDEIVNLLTDFLGREDFDYVYSLCDAILNHDLSFYPAFYRATFEVLMARSQPDDSEPDAEERLKMAKAVLEEEERKVREESKTVEPRVEVMLAQVVESLTNCLSECPPRGHPDRRERRKIYNRADMQEVDEDIEEGDAEEDGEEDMDVESEDGHTHQHEHEHGHSEPSHGHEGTSVSEPADTSKSASDAVQTVAIAAPMLFDDTLPAPAVAMEGTSDTASPIDTPDNTAESSSEAPQHPETSPSTAPGIAEQPSSPEPATKDDEQSEKQPPSKKTERSKAKPRKNLPGSTRMRQANKEFIGRSGLGGTVESGKRVPKASKRHVKDIFKEQGDGGAGSGGGDGAAGEGAGGEKA